jgi:hypothetical protein
MCGIRLPRIECRAMRGGNKKAPEGAFLFKAQDLVLHA